MECYGAEQCRTSAMFVYTERTLGTAEVVAVIVGSCIRGGTGLTYDICVYVCVMFELVLIGLIEIASETILKTN